MILAHPQKPMSGFYTERGSNQARHIKEFYHQRNNGRLEHAFFYGLNTTMQRKTDEVCIFFHSNSSQSVDWVGGARKTDRALRAGKDADLRLREFYER